MADWRRVQIQDEQTATKCNSSDLSARHDQMVHVYHAYEVLPRSKAFFLWGVFN
jgi:hypothetical protein